MAGILDERVTGKKFCTPQHPRVEPLTVSQVLQKRPSELPIVRKDSSSLATLKLMVEHEVTAVPVMDGDGICGIFSEHDVIQRLIRDPSTVAGATVGEIMAPCGHTARPGDLMHDCLNRMFENRLHHLPVVEESNPIAVLSLDILLQAMVEHLEAIHREILTGQQVMFLRGTYSC